MALLIQNAADIKNPWTHWFFYGESGAGKTTAAGTFPRPLFLVPTQERSHVTLQGREDVDFILVNDSLQMLEALDELDRRSKAARPYWDDGSEEALDKAEEVFPWQSVVVESVSHYADLLQEELTERGRFDMTYSKWGKLGGHLRTVHARLRDLPVHVAFTALEDRKFDEKKNLVSGGPMFPTKAAYKLPSACDAVVYFERRSGKPNDIFTAHFRKRSVFNARVRWPALRKQPKMQPFDFAEVEKLLG